MHLKKLLFLLLIFTNIQGQSQTLNDKRFKNYPMATDKNLWIEYSPSKTTFRLWSPEAEAVKLHIYDKNNKKHIEFHHLIGNKNGVWEVSLIDRDCLGYYYTFQTKHNGKYLDETPGIYAQAVGINGKRAMVVDLSGTNPLGWTEHERPPLKSVNDIILYELHVRDFTIHPKSGAYNPGKFVGLIEEKRRISPGFPTGIDHIKELGVTHVHLLPAFDYRSVDESKLHKPQFNWGYDPENYNVPEGSYSTDPSKAEVRIKEFKKMVMGFHNNGIRVIMDVVYNHTGKTANSNFNLEAPGYYYRQTEDGGWSNASGCGNETASERFMMRKYIIESCKYWATEYMIDGFRFDLMGIHDIETMNLLSEELKKIDPTIFVYGEGWTAGGSPLPDSIRALKANTSKLTDIAVFSDDIRDGIKGSVFNKKERGFASGEKNKEETIKFGVVGSTHHPQVNYKKTSSEKYWANKPGQCISYVSCHDNHTLYDKLRISCDSASTDDIKKMHCLSNAIVLTSQGIPFLHAGVEMMRTKKGEHNSYNLPDEINQIDWSRKEKHEDIFEYYKSLIELRKAHPAFKMPTTKMVQDHLRFIDTEVSNVVAYQISDNANGDDWKNIIVVYNAKKKAIDFELPKGKWDLAAYGKKILDKDLGNAERSIRVPKVSMCVLYQK